MTGHTPPSRSCSSEVATRPAFTSNRVTRSFASAFNETRRNWWTWTSAAYGQSPWRESIIGSFCTLSSEIQTSGRCSCGHDQTSASDGASADCSRRTLRFTRRRYLFDLRFVRRQGRLAVCRTPPPTPLTKRRAADGHPVAPDRRVPCGRFAILLQCPRCRSIRTTWNQTSLTHRGLKTTNGFGSWSGRSTADSHYAPSPRRWQSHVRSSSGSINEETLNSGAVCGPTAQPSGLARRL